MQLTPGARLGRYAVTAKLGEGGMGEVWGATDVHLGRKVAVKVLRRELAADAGSVSRFEREAKLLAKLNHPNVAQIFGLEVDGMVLALVMEFVEGPTLAEQLQRRAQSLEETVSIARQIAEALEEAHEKEIVHRDLKPQNVKLTARGQVKVLDFGLAKALGSSAKLGGVDLADASTVVVTQQSAILGTPSYMAPEQARGVEVDRRADIWTFGTMLYEMLTGRRLFTGASSVEILSAVLNQEIDLDRDLASSPGPLRELVRRCLERDPRRRLRDIGEARIVLENCAAGATAKSGSPAQSSVGSTPSVAVLPFVNMSADPENEYFADGMTEDVIAHLSKVRALRVTSRTSVMGFKRHDQNLKDIGAVLGVGAIVEGSVRRAGNRVRIVAQLVDPSIDQHLWAESYDRELDDIFAIQTDVALQIASALKAELTRDERARIGLRPTPDVEAYELYLRGRERFASFTNDGFVQSLALFEHAVARDPGFAMAHVEIAHVRIEFAITGIAGTQPSEAFARAQFALDRALALDDSFAEVHQILGLLLLTRDFDWQNAESEFHVALQLSPGSAGIYDHLGWLYSSQQRFDESLAMLRRARELNPLWHQTDYANELIRAGRPDEALAGARHAIALDPTRIRAHSVFGWACIALGRTDEGVAAMEHACQLAKRSTLFLGQLGQAYGMTGREAQAQAVLAELKEMDQTHYVAPYHFANVYTGLGEHDTAIDFLERALEERSGGIYGIKGSYLFAPLRAHPRFQALLRKMNL